MTRHFAYYCPELSCRARMVKRRKPGGGQHYVCSTCRSTIEIPEREKMILAGMPELPGFTTVQDTDA
jgi:hypothetical protein